MAMGEARQEPSMEDILASIKRIIAEDGNAAATAPRPAASADAADPSSLRGFTPLHLVEEYQDDLGDGPGEVLELTDTVESAELAPTATEAPEPAPVAQAAPTPQPAAPAVAPASPIVSPDAALASRQSLAALSALVVKPEPGSENTLEGLVREMLRPMLKDWLDENLPEVVRELVEREIERISGRAL